MTLFTPPDAPTVASCVADARSASAGSDYLSQAHCVDWLLDCFNAAVRPSVRHVVAEMLGDISAVTLVPAPVFDDMLDLVQLALQVDAAFDHLELGAA